MKPITHPFRKLLLIACSLFWLSAAQAQTYGENFFIIHDAVGKPDSTAVIYIEIVNEDYLFAFQVDLPLPDGFSYVSGSAWLNPARKVDHFIQGNMLPGTNILRLLSFAYTGEHYPGNDGIIAKFDLNLPTQTGEYLLMPDTVILGGLYGVILSSTFNGTVYITPEGPVPGDANCDGLVNVNDVITTIQYILLNIPKPFCFANADLNDELEVDVTDVVGIIQIILQIE